MTLFKNKYRVESTRLQGYDYTQPGAYFITIVTYNRACLFGKIINGEMILNEYGEIVKNEWEKTGIIRPNIIIDKYIIMPNHLHGILIINDNICRDTLQRVSTIEKFGKPTKNSIPTIVRSFKSTTTKQINIIRKSLTHDYGKKIIMNTSYATLMIYLAFVNILKKILQIGKMMKK
jgi:putative transposase